MDYNSMVRLAKIVLTDKQSGEPLVLDVADLKRTHPAGQASHVYTYSGDVLVVKEDGNAIKAACDVFWDEWLAEFPA